MIGVGLHNVTICKHHLMLKGHCVLNRGVKVVWTGEMNRVPTDVFFDMITLHPDDYDEFIRSFDDGASYS